MYVSHQGTMHVRCRLTLAFLGVFDLSSLFTHFKRTANTIFVKRCNVHYAYAKHICTPRFNPCMEDAIEAIKRMLCDTPNAVEPKAKVGFLGFLTTSWPSTTTRNHIRRELENL